MLHQTLSSSKATTTHIRPDKVDSATSPFGDKGFIVQRKGGDASILRKNNALLQAVPRRLNIPVDGGQKVTDIDGTVSRGGRGSFGITVNVRL
jgi:hypothetical protein